MASYVQYEEVVISALLNNPELIFTVNLESRWFIKYRRIIDAMQSLAGAGITIDVFSIMDKIGDQSLLGRLVDVQKNVHGSKNNYAGNIEKLQAHFEADAIHKAIKKADIEIGEGEPPNSVIATLISESMQIAGAEGKNYLYNATESLQVFIERIEEIYDTAAEGGLGLKTGINQLDKAMGGMHPSDMCIVGARPGAGKTAFGITVLREIARQGKKVGFFSTEMSVFQVMSRFVAQEGKINAHKLRDANLDEQDFARITAATSVIRELSIRICDKPAITIGELSMQARAWQADGGLDFIVVDYLTRLHPNKVSYSQNQNLEVGVIVTELKNLARNLNIPVMVLAQLNRQGSSRKDKRPIMSDLRDSGIIEQEADQILMLYRPDSEESEDILSPEIIIEKNRHGETGIIRVDFEPEIMLWKEHQHSYS